MIAASGLQVGVGTSAAIQRSTAAVMDRNLAMTRANGGRTAAMSRMRSRGLLAQGRQAATQGVVEAGSTMLNSYTQTG